MPFSRKQMDALSAAFSEPPFMTAAQFTDWLIDMKHRGLIQSDAEAARLLDVSANSVVTFKKQGGNRRLALACAALLAGLQPYGGQTE